MIKVFATDDYLLDFIDRDRDQFEIIRQMLRRHVAESDLNRNDVISTCLKEGSKIANDLDAFSKTYAIGNCAITKIGKHIILTDYTEIDLDEENDIEFKLVRNRIVNYDLYISRKKLTTL